MFDDFTLAQHGEPSPDFTALRQHAEALAAFCRAQLPPGDAGLIEAARRLAEVNAAVMALGCAGETGIRIEDEIIEPIVNVAEDGLIAVIERQAPETLIGAAVKIRHMLEFDVAEDALRQVLALIEREIGPSTSSGLRGRRYDVRSLFSGCP
jgi:hypothetical protein